VTGAPSTTPAPDASDYDDWNRDFDPRSDARERALNVLFEADVRGNTPSEVVARIQVPLDDLTMMIVDGVAEQRAKIDSIITTHSHSWTLDRERRALYESVADARVDTAGLDIDEVVSAAAAALAKVRAS
jgi:hypothetical protein